MAVYSSDALLVTCGCDYFFLFSKVYFSVFSSRANKDVYVIEYI